MVGLRWLKLDQTGLTEAPEELGKLQKLVHSYLFFFTELQTCCSFINFWNVGTFELEAQQT